MPEPGSAVVKLFDMTVAVTGMNERTVKAKGIEYDKTYTYSASHAGYYPGARNLSVKVLWDRNTLRLLGAQIVGFEGVDKRMDVLATAIRLGAKVTDLKELELVYAPPFGSAKDPVNMAGYVAENVCNRQAQAVLLGSGERFAPGWERDAAGRADAGRGGHRAH